MPTSKAEERAAQKRAEILAAATDVFAEKGYHASKISDIAERLGMGHGTFYRYFKNKLDIFATVIDMIISKIGDVVSYEEPNASNSALEYRQQITRIGKRMFLVFQDDIRMGRIIFYETLGVDPDLDDKLEGVLALTSQYIELYLKNGLEKGFLRPDLDTEVLSRAITGMMVAGIRDVLNAENPEETTKRWSKAVAGLMIGGMAKDRRE